MRTAICVLLFCLMQGGSMMKSQTVIDLGRGGGVRSKTIDDYTRDREHIRKRQAADSIAYSDCLRRAFSALYTDSLPEARKLFEEALRLRPLSPSNYVVRRSLGRIYLAEGNFGRAAELLTAVLKEKPDEAEARMDRATVYLELDNPQEAEKDCNVLIEENLLPDRLARLHFIRGAARMRQKLYAPARSDFETCLRLEPNSTGAALLLASAYEEDNRLREALERLDFFVESHPENADGLVMRARIEEKEGMDDAARADYDKALRLRPRDGLLYVARAEVLLRLGARGSARKDLDEAVRLGIPRSALKSLYQKL